LIVVTEREGVRALAALSEWGRWLAHAAAVIVIAQVEPHEFDAGRCAQNMMIAAWADGIGSCPAHLPEAEVARLLGIPKDVHVNRVIGFGSVDGRSRQPRDRLRLRRSRARRSTQVRRAQAQADRGARPPRALVGRRALGHGRRTCTPAAPWCESQDVAGPRRIPPAPAAVVTACATPAPPAEWIGRASNGERP